VVRLIRAVAPIMRERRAGTIVNLSSVAGHISAPFSGAYSASKHAVEALSEALWFELRPFGVRVVLIEPGAFETQFGANIIDAPGFDAASPYAPLAARFSAAMEGFRSGPPQQPTPPCATSPAMTPACWCLSIAPCPSRASQEP